MDKKVARLTNDSGLIIEGELDESNVGAIRLDSNGNLILTELDETATSLQFGQTNLKVKSFEEKGNLNV